MMINYGNNSYEFKHNKYYNKQFFLSDVHVHVHCMDYMLNRLIHVQCVRAYKCIYMYMYNSYMDYHGEWYCMCF